MPKTKILIAIDEPERAKIIVDTVCNFIDSQNTEITLVNVIETNISEESYFYSEPEKFINHEAEKSVFAEIEAFLENSAIDYKGFLYKEGNAAKIISKLCEGYDLLVIGSHNKNPIERLLLGSVAYKLIRTAKTSVLVVNNKYMPQSLDKPTFSALMGVDFSESSVYTAENLHKFLNKNKAEITLLHVAVEPSLIIPPDVYIYIDMAKIIEETNKVSENLLCLIENKLKETGLNVVKKYFIQGSVASQLIDESNKNDNDLIVVGAQGKGRFGRWMLGSVSSKIAEQSRQPVLIIKE
jgi:nucleotide-binding universal stress UspA family protein